MSVVEYIVKPVLPLFEVFGDRDLVVLYFDRLWWSTFQP